MDQLQSLVWIAYEESNDTKSEHLRRCAYCCQVAAWNSIYQFVTANCIITREYVNIVPTNCNFRIFELLKSLKWIYCTVGSSEKSTSNISMVVILRRLRCILLSSSLTSCCWKTTIRSAVVSINQIKWTYFRVDGGVKVTAEAQLFDQICNLAKKHFTCHVNNSSIRIELPNTLFFIFCDAQEIIKHWITLFNKMKNCWRNSTLSVFSILLMITKIRSWITIICLKKKMRRNRPKHLLICWSKTKMWP